MVEADRVIFIQDMQCQHSSFSTKYKAALSIGSCIKEYARRAIQLRYLLRTWYRYTAYTSVVTTSWQIVFNQDVLNTIYNIQLQFQSNDFGTYVGSGDGEDVAAFFEAAINSGTSSHNVSAEKSGNILYFYSYDVSYNYTTAPVATITPVQTPVIATATVTSLEDSPETILNLWNCLTLEKLCNIKTYFLSLINK